ncbi:MAG: transporter substrate-binding domain-containing protein, partial [Clostridiales bacterium]|nr:transporter substrate-binding domain-containing protein [Clostridiales bacterium]
MVMKTITKIVAGVLSSALLLGMTSCATTETTATTAAAETSAADSSADETTEAAAGELTTVTAGKLTMATNAFFPPYEYYEGEDIVGIDAEIAKAVADKLGLELV